VITNSVGNVTSAKVALTLVAADQAGRIINLSVRTDVVTAGDGFTLGYVVGGPGTSGSQSNARPQSLGSGAQSRGRRAS